MAESRDQRVSIRLSKAEKEMLERLADANGMSKTGLIVYLLRQNMAVMMKSEKEKQSD